RRRLDGSARAERGHAEGRWREPEGLFDSRIQDLVLLWRAGAQRFPQWRRGSPVEVYRRLSGGLSRDSAVGGQCHPERSEAESKEPVQFQVHGILRLRAFRLAKRRSAQDDEHL